MNDLVQLLGGGVLLYFGAEWLVAGSSSIALSLRVPKIIVGLTVVAYGTSAPELVVGVQATAEGHGGVALGNVVGSNIANLGLILGVAALVRPTQIQSGLRRRELPVLLLVTALMPLLLITGRVDRLEGGLLLAGAFLYTAWMVHSARAGRRAARAGPEAEEATPPDALAGEAAVAMAAQAEAAGLAGGGPGGRGRTRQIISVVAGLGLLVLGGRLLVDAATELALAWGMSERVVGLTVVAIGTSLPELATCVIAAVRGHADLAVGNVVGSNIFNVLLCLGAAAAVRPISASPSDVAPDLIALGFLTLLGVVFLRTARTMTRAEGLVMAVAYAGFLGYLVASGAG